MAPIVVPSLPRKPSMPGGCCRCYAWLAVAAAVHFMPCVVGTEFSAARQGGGMSPSSVILDPTGPVLLKDAAECFSRGVVGACCVPVTCCPMPVGVRRELYLFCRLCSSHGPATLVNQGYSRLEVSSGLVRGIGPSQDLNSSLCYQCVLQVSLWCTWQAPADTTAYFPGPHLTRCCADSRSASQECVVGHC